MTDVCGWLVLLAYVLSGCGASQRVMVAEEEALAAHQRACEAKATIVAAMYPCAEAVVRLNSMAMHDIDCHAYFGDAGIGVHCEGEGPRADR